MVLNVKKLVPHAKLPERATPGSAGYDLYSTEGYVIQPGHRAVVSTGITVQLPPGTYGRIAPRSGLAVKHGIDVLAGVIDPDYTGELKVVLYYRIAQLILEKYESPEVWEIETIDLTTERGESGFGSTGVAYKVTGV